MSDGLVSYWPLDTVSGGKTPDLVNGYDFSAYVGGARTLTNGNGIKLVSGYRSNAVSFASANQVLLAYLPGPNDQLPINKNPAFTISFWVNGPPNQGDLRMFSEGNITNNNPLFNLGANPGNAFLDLYLRQQPSAAEIEAGFGNFGNPANHTLSTSTVYDNTWHHITFVQQADGTRTLYVDGIADGLEIPAKTEGAWNLSATSIGGILRATAAAWATALIDDVALWKRALSLEEINEVKVAGVPKTFTRKAALQIRGFSSDLPLVVEGERVTLSWDASADASLTLAPGIGDVTAKSPFGVGSTNIVINADTTFTLTATRGSESTNRQVTVHTVRGIAPGWRVIDTFDHRTLGPIGDQPNWESSLIGQRGAEVLQTFNNRVLGIAGANVLAASHLTSMSIAEGKTNTLFFRFYLSPEIDVPDAESGTMPDLDIQIGLTEKSLRGVGDFQAGVNGPYIRLYRNNSGAGGGIDLLADNGVNNALGGYSYLSDAVSNPGLTGLELGKVYTVWLDVINRPFDVVDGVQNGGDIYSVYIQKEGDAARKNLFEGFVANRDAITFDPVLGAPIPPLIDVYLCASSTVTLQATNVARFDDFFLSSNGINSTVPIAAKSFQVGSEQLQILNSAYTSGAKSFAITWRGSAGKTYTVQKRSAIDSGTWANLVTGYPTGGVLADGPVTFTESNVAGAATFYRISTP